MWRSEVTENVSGCSGVISSWGLLMREMNAGLHQHHLEDGM